mmetsp:Transcript_111513/g.255728  ORF Transcript_111513/g.255728 Transcript_111513/m.255728 type:complete len:266 (-) Transcript_111513:13-810(-)
MCSREDEQDKPGLLLIDFIRSISARGAPSPPPASQPPPPGPGPVRTSPQSSPHLHATRSPIPAPVDPRPPRGVTPPPPPPPGTFDSRMRATGPPRRLQATVPPAGTRTRSSIGEVAPAEDPGDQSSASRARSLGALPRPQRLPDAATRRASPPGGQRSAPLLTHTMVQYPQAPRPTTRSPSPPCHTTAHQSPPEPGATVVRSLSHGAAPRPATPRGLAPATQLHCRGPPVALATSGFLMPAPPGMRRVVSPSGMQMPRLVPFHHQ